MKTNPLDSRKNIHCYPAFKQSVVNDEEGGWYVVIDGVSKERARDVWQLFQEKHGPDHMIAVNQVQEVLGNLAFRMPKGSDKQKTKEVVDLFSIILNSRRDIIQWLSQEPENPQRMAS